MQICHVIANLESGGAENHLRALSEGQKKLNLDVRIVVLNYLDRNYVDTFSPKVPIHDLTELSILRKVLSLRKLLKACNVNLIHAHLPRAEIMVAIATFRVRICKVATRHVTGNYSQRWQRNYFLPLSKVVLRRFNLVIAISQAVANSLFKNERIDPRIVKVVLYGFQSKHSVYKPGIARNTRNVTEQFKIVSVMRLETQKRPMDVLLAFNMFAREVHNATLDIYGDGSLREELGKKVRELGLSEKIKLHGKVTDVVDKLHEYDAFVLASEYEGFGLVYLEAMSVFLPIITSSNEAALEIFGTETCIFFETGDVQALFNGLMYTFYNFEEVMYDIQSNYPELIKKYSLSKMIDKTTSIYKSLL